MRTFVMGDIHGSAKGLSQALERSGFKMDEDRLIQLGDVVDGWPETPECIEILKSIKHRVQIIGNHDYWFHEWMQLGRTPEVWVTQGGKATLDAYIGRRPELIPKHREFFKPGKKTKFYHVDEKNRIYCHGGFMRRIKLEAQLDDMFMWDRSLATKAVSGATSGFKVDEFEHVFLGHTDVANFKNLPPCEPFTGGNVTLMDTGGGWDGVVTIMDVDTMEYWSSDLCKELYPNSRGRK